MSTVGVTQTAVGYYSSRPLFELNPAQQPWEKAPKQGAEAANEIVLHFHMSNSRPFKCTHVTSRQLRHSNATDRIPRVMATLTVADSSQHGAGSNSARPSGSQEDRSGTLGRAWGPLQAPGLPFSQATAPPLHGHLSFPRREQPPGAEPRPRRANRQDGYGQGSRACPPRGHAHNWHGSAAGRARSRSPAPNAPRKHVQAAFLANSLRHAVLTNEDSAAALPRSTPPQDRQTFTC